MNAYMIMCHTNPHQITRLCDQCRSNDNDIFIHIDRKMNQEECEVIQKYVYEKKGVFLCEERYHGELDKRSLVDIVIAMVRSARENEVMTGIRYKYYLLLSGQDYPIKKIAQISEALEKNYPKPFIDCTPYSRHNWIYYKFISNKSTKVLHEWISNSFNKGFVRYVLRVVAILFTHLNVLIHTDSFHKLRSLGIDIYGGSAWWILPDQIMDFILAEINRGAEYLDIILNESNTPEETFFQTLSMRSPLNSMIEVNHEDMILQNCKTWAYFFDEGKPFMGHPYIFTIDEYAKLKNADAFWFARKFDDRVDKEILCRIDRDILNV